MCMFVFVLKVLNNLSQVKIINRLEEATKGSMLLERWMWKGHLPEDECQVQQHAPIGCIVVICEFSGMFLTP